MIKISETYRCPFFEYFYMFVMVIYMAQMTPETGRMVGTLSGNPIPFLIPIVLTGILLYRHPISFSHKKLWMFVGVMGCWSLAICYELPDFSTSNLSYYFFLFYSIFIAFIHVRVYKRSLFLIYEHIMVVFAAISLVGWGIAVVFPFTGDFFLLFPETSFGNNVLYLFHWMNPAKGQIYGSLLRNAGCSWEPGRFAIMLIPAILINLSRKGIVFRRNKKIIVLLLALASTMSTTGYSTVLLLYSIFWLEKITLKKIFSFVFIILPFIVYVFSFNFMAEKIQDRADFEGLSEEQIEKMEYIGKISGDGYVGSLDRFESAYFDWKNFQEEPFLGYGRNRDYSWFRKELTENFELTGGLVKLFSQYGVFVALLLYYILFISSVKISRLFVHQRKYALALTILLSSVSYSIFTIPIFTAFWLYGLFCREDEKDARFIVKLKPLSRIC